MTQKEKLIYLIKEYCLGNYATSIFCDEFTRILCTENDNSLDKKEKDLFFKSNEVISRFSPYEDDVKNGYLFNEEKVKREILLLIESIELEM